MWVYFNCDMRYVFFILWGNKDYYYYLQYQNSIKQTSDENIEKYPSRDYQLIQHQVVRMNIMRIIWQTVSRITKEILVVKGLSRFKLIFMFPFLGISCCLLNQIWTRTPLQPSFDQLKRQKSSENTLQRHQHQMFQQKESLTMIQNPIQKMMPR